MNNFSLGLPDLKETRGRTGHGDAGTRGRGDAPDTVTRRRGEAPDTVTR
ncbi:MAG: hypothetical protein F6K41_37955, partial [Symploca sp. SIO3E6]|nr:hypothetical protein [Caldora sp. SIO3E6]